MNKQEQHNQVSIIINGVRYDAVEVDDYKASCAKNCDLACMCFSHCNANLCEFLGISWGYYFKKSDKKFEA